MKGSAIFRNKLHFLDKKHLNFMIDYRKRNNKLN